MQVASVQNFSPRRDRGLRSERPSDLRLPPQRPRRGQKQQGWENERENFFFCCVGNAYCDVLYNASTQGATSALATPTAASTAPTTRSAPPAAARSTGTSRSTASASRPTTAVAEMTLIKAPQPNRFDYPLLFPHELQHTSASQVCFRHGSVSQKLLTFCSILQVSHLTDLASLPTCTLQWDGMCQQDLEGIANRPKSCSHFTHFDPPPCHTHDPEKRRERGKEDF